MIKGARLRVMAHDVIVRGLRFRIGDQPGYDYANRDAIGLSADNSHEVYNVIIDSNSLAWAVDENASSWDNSGAKNKIHDVTWSYNIISEGLKCSFHPETTSSCTDSGFTTHHSMGLLIGDFNQRVSAHHNLLTSNVGRNVRFAPDSTGALINNVIYNWGLEPTVVDGLSGTNRADIIANYYLPTAGSVTRQGGKHGIYLKCGLKSTSQVYVNGNIGAMRTDDSQDQWQEVVVEACSNGTDWQAVKKSAPVTTITARLTPTAALTAYNEVISQAGARSPQLDPADQRIIQSVLNRSVPDPANFPGRWHLDTPPAWPDYPAGISPADSRTAAPSGYSWLETYINSLINFSAPAAVPGDANGDGLVNGVDYVIWLNHFGQTVAGASNGDFDNNNHVDGVDYVIWLNHYEG